ncbi:MAG TPA: hypothetical protein VLT36_19280, partial [Candidatus Dormibacteraeota bacterium]|nr:hypothetical protein [Candidatus Dormibacteraeota bacterium]
MKAPVRLSLCIGLVVCLPTPHLEGQSIWNATNGIAANTNWSTAANWSPSGAPNSGTNVVFTNNAVVSTLGTMNNVVDGTTTIGSLRYSNTNNTHTTLIPAGVTLNITGSGGANSTALCVGTEAAPPGDLPIMTNKIAGVGGTLVINNTGANLIVRQSPQGTTATANRMTLDMSGLDNFNAALARVMLSGNSPTALNRASGRLTLARTNSINASGTAPALLVGESTSNNGGGSTLVLGQTNVLTVNGIAIGRTKESGSAIRFNAAFTSPFAYIRSSSGGRVPSWTLGDGGSDSGTTTCNGTADFSLGTVDAQVDTMQVGRGSSAGTGGNQSVGTVTIAAGTMDINTLQLGLQGASGPKGGSGTMNVNGTAVLVVNTTLELGRTVGGDGFTNTIGKLAIGGGTVRVSSINANFGSTNNAIAMSNGLLVITNTAGPGIMTFAMTNSTLQLAAGVSANVVVTNFNTGGSTNTIGILSLPAMASYPTQLPLVSYAGAIGGVGFNFSLGSLPASTPAFTGFLSNNVSAGTIDVVITGGPVPPKVITWTADFDEDWDTTTPNWTTNGFTSTTYNHGDFVTFDDSALDSGVNLTTNLTPTSLTVSNNSLDYVFYGPGEVSGSFTLVKRGNSALYLDNSGPNSFSGGISLLGGALVVGANDTYGSLGSGAITMSNNAVLIFNRTDNLTVPNAISGAGVLLQNETSVLALSASNSFSGPVLIGQGTIKLGNANALGSGGPVVVVSNGATIDFNGFFPTNETITVSGSGVGTNGALINNGATVFPATTNVTLAGDTTFGGTVRWDLRSINNVVTNAVLATSPPNSPYKLTKVGTNQIGIVACAVDPAIADIDVQGGTLSIEKVTSSLGNPANTLTLHPGTSLSLFQVSNTLSKVVVMQDGSSMNNSSGNNTFGGPLTLQGSNAFTVPSGQLELTNTINGPGTFFKISGNMTLDGMNSFGGGMVIAGGGMRFNSDAAAGTGTITVNATNSNVTLRNLTPVILSTVTNPIVLIPAPNLVTIDEDGGTGTGNLTLNGPISGSGGAIRGFNATANDGVVTLSGDNSGWSGGLTHARGTLSLGHKNALGTGAYTIQGATNSSYTPVFIQATTPLRGASAITTPVNANTNFTIRGANDIEFSGAINLSSGTRLLTNINSGATILSGPVSGAGGLTLEGTGTLTVAGNVNIAGMVTQNGGRSLWQGVICSGPVVGNAGVDIRANGTIFGSVTVSNGGSFGAGTLSSAGFATMTNGLDLSAGATNVWKLAANADTGPGSNFDQLVVTGGNLVLGGLSRLLIQFTGSATLPNMNDYFWMTPHEWTIVSLSGGAANPGNLVFVSVLGGNGVGAFTPVANNGSVIMHYNPPPPPITCSTNKTVLCGTAWTFDPPTETGPCGTNLSITVLSTITNGTDCSGIITRTWRIIDACNNTNSCNQIVTVQRLGPDVYTSILSGKWEGGTNWLLGRPITNDVVLITNAGSKTVTIDDTTTATNSDSLRMTSVTISAPAGATNTLALSNAGTTVPLHITTSLNLRSGGALTVDGSALQVDGLLALGNDITNTGNGSTISIGDSSVFAGSFSLGSVAGGFGSLTLLTNGVLTVSSNVTLISGSLSQTSSVVIAGGTLAATNGSIVIGSNGAARLNLTGGFVRAAQIKLGGDTNSSGELIIAGGSLQSPFLSANLIVIGGGDLDNSGGTVIIGEDHPAAIYVTDGSAHNINTLTVGLNAPGTYVQQGGTVSVSSIMTVGDCANNVVGSCTLSSVSLSVANDQHSAVLEIKDGTFQLNGGTLNVDTLRVRTACGHFVRNGGEINHYHPPDLDPALDADGDGYSNGEEMLANTDPLDPTSFPRPTLHVMLAGTALTIFWESHSPGYCLSQNTDLTVVDGWQPFTESSVSDNGTIRYVTTTVS